MSRAVSVHVGVNRPAGRNADRPLQYCESLAWRMAGLASEAGFESIHLLRGREATLAAVHDALTGAARTLRDGDTFLLTFCGHGGQVRDGDGDDGWGWDETWCLADGELLDDRLAGYWRLFEPGVRVLLLPDSCFGGGSGRDGDEPVVAYAPGEGPVIMRDGGTTWDGRHGRTAGGARSGGFDRGAGASRGGGFSRDGGTTRDGGIGRDAGSSRDGGIARDGSLSRSGRVRTPAPDYGGACIVEPPRVTDGIRASVLVMAGAHEDQAARESLYTRHLLDQWAEGTFRGSYCDLHRHAMSRVMLENCRQMPQMVMLGAPDPDFPLETAFHVRRSSH